VYRGRPWQVDEEADDQVARRQTGGLVGIVIILVLLIVGLFLVRQLRIDSELQDCLLAGHRNCDLLVHGASEPPSGP
jgi:hypothetical protein